MSDEWDVSMPALFLNDVTYVKLKDRSFSKQIRVLNANGVAWCHSRAGNRMSF